MLNLDTLKIIRYCAGAYPKRFALMIACLIFAGFAEGIGLVTLLPLLELAMRRGSESKSSLTILVEQIFAYCGVAPTIGSLLVLIVLGIAVKGIFMVAAMRQVGYTVAFVMTDFRLRLIRALLKARWSYFIEQPVGTFVNSMGAETLRAATAYHSAALMLANIIQAIFYALLSFLVSWQVTALAFISSLVLIFTLKGFIRKSGQAGENQTNLFRSMSSRLADLLNGIKPIKAMALEDRVRTIIEGETFELNNAMKKEVWAGEALKNINEPFLVLLIAAGLYVALAYGNIEFSTLIVMAFLFQRLLTRVHAVQQNKQASSVGESAFWSLEKTIADAEAQAEGNRGDRTPILKTSIELSSLSFSHGKKLILDHGNLTIPAKKITAIVGESGAGKTTVADLVLGLFQPNSGQVLIDGVPLNELKLDDWRKNIGYVPQEMFLFHQSVLKNITLGDDNISAEEVKEALVAAGAWDFIQSLSERLDTVVGERGTKLSGGQRQRLAIARALVRKPQLLILDEVTTSLDPSTEAALCETISELRSKTTVLAISHQPAIMKIADGVYRLESGKIALVAKPYSGQSLGKMS